ncbi:hypothetical protein BH11PLA2_BH11PLA2_33550 [soil metagenome]
MEYYTLKNLAIAGLVQVGAVVAVVLASGTAYRSCVAVSYTIPEFCTQLTEYGWFLLVFPLTWIVVGADSFSGKYSDRRRLVVVASGVLILGIILTVGWYGAAQPWLNSMRRGDSLSS